MKIRKIKITDIDGFKLGNAENIDKATGCTVVICEKGAVGGVDVRGGGPATRETDLLKSENTVESINAVVLSGGSAFGLEAACGVMNELSEKGIGFKVGDISVPIVCGASLFDLAVADGKTYPDKEMGRQACRNAYEGIFANGNSGAGTGASVGKLSGMSRAMKTGLGTFACADENLQVGAVVAVNAVGDVYNGAGNIIAGMRNEDGSQIYGSIKHLKSMVYDINSLSNEHEEHKEVFTISSANDERIKTKSEIATAIRNAFSNSVNPKNTSAEVSAEISEQEAVVAETPDTESLTDRYLSDDMMVTGRFKKYTDDIYVSDNEAEQSIEEQPAEVISEEAEDVFVKEYEHEPSHEPAVETTANNESAAASDIISNVSENENTEEDFGYDIPFNTTIACLITNAKMTKAQCNKLASVLHDAYARAIKPVHSTLDGDTVFVLTTAEKEVNFDAFAALATDVLQYAIIDGATSAESAYGLPSAHDIIK